MTYKPASYRGTIEWYNTYYYRWRATVYRDEQYFASENFYTRLHARLWLHWTVWVNKWSRYQNYKNSQRTTDIKFTNFKL